MTEASRRTGGRRNRGQPRERIVQASPAYVTREIPFYAMLDEEVLVKIENQAARIIQEIGLEFREDEVALQLWREAGADVQGTRVRAPRGMVRALCQTAPNEFEQVARNLERSVRMGGRHQVFAPVYGSPFVRDLEGGRRCGTLEDFTRLVKLTHIAQALAEAMMCCAFAQLVRPGSPFIMGNFLSSMSLKSRRLLLGCRNH